MSQSELACTYASLILYDDGATISADKINKILKAADVKVEPYWPTLFAKFLQGRDLGSLISNTGAPAAGPAVSAGAPAAGAPAAAAPQEAKKEEAKKEEVKEESDEDMGFGLFD